MNERDSNKAQLNFFRSTFEKVKDLMKVNPKIYWFDLLASTTIGYSAFTLAYIFSEHGLGLHVVLLTLVASLALYRAFMFIHEIVHIKASDLPSFERMWNILAGAFFFIPTSFYHGIHVDHHKLNLYGTEVDPEYLPFGSNKAQLLSIFLLLPFTTLLYAGRFLILAPLTVLIPPLRGLVLQNASALVLNAKYKRRVTDTDRKRIFRSELLVLAVWSVPIGGYLLGLVDARLFLLWFCTTAIYNVINGLRTFAAHRYKSQGQPMSMEEQFLDSVNAEGGVLSALWAPVGLRYHALHHLFQSMPYHQLGKAHKRLKEDALSADTEQTYLKPSRSSFLKTILELIRS